MKKVKYLIIGAGVTGLGFANIINNDDYLILEREKEPGGYCRTVKNKGFTWDFAGHFFHFADSRIKKFFENNVDNREIIHQVKNTKIYYNNNLIDYPFQKNIHQLDKKEFIDCLFDLFNREDKDIYNDFQDMLYSKFGKSITEKFLKPYNEKLYACELNLLDPNAMGRFFPHAKPIEIIRNFKNSDNDSYNTTFMYPRNGAITFINALLKNIDARKIQYNEEVIKIDTNKKVAQTRVNSYKYDYLINTSPFDILIKMINNTDYYNNRNLLTSNKVLVFNLGFNKKSHIDNVHWLYVPSKIYNFYRVGFYDNILESDRLSLYVEIAFSSNVEINIDEQLNSTLKNLKEIGIITDHELLAKHYVIMNPAYVHISDDANKYVQNKKIELSKDSIFTIGRYGDWKYCSIEDSLKDAFNLAETFNNAN